jgi:hypothetical protein
MAIQGNDGYWYNSQVDADAGNPSGRVGYDSGYSSSKSSGPSDGEQRYQENLKWRAEQEAKSKAFLAELAKEQKEMDRIDAEVQSLNVQGFELICQQKYDNAISVLDKAISLSAYFLHYGDSYAFRGRCYLSKGNFDEALKNLNMAVYSLSPDASEKKEVVPVKLNNIPSVFALRGLIFEKKGDINKAIACFKIAADWDYYVCASAKEGGYQVDVDSSDALKKLKMLGVEYTAQVPLLPTGWEKRRPKDSSFTPISTADVKVSSNSASQTSSGVTCKQCGKALKAGAKFCGGCGTKVG